jgi:hypothetical protein
MTMKTLLFAALLVTLASTAHAVEMPKELRGIWLLRRTLLSWFLDCRCDVSALLLILGPWKREYR